MTGHLKTNYTSANNKKRNIKKIRNFQVAIGTGLLINKSQK